VFDRDAYLAHDLHDQSGWRRSDRVCHNRTRFAALGPCLRLAAVEFFTNDPGTSVSLLGRPPRQRVFIRPSSSLRDISYFLSRKKSRAHGTAPKATRYQSQAAYQNQAAYKNEAAFLGSTMRIRAGYHLGFETFGPTPMNFLISVLPERQRDLLTPEYIRFDPFIPARQDPDAFGNIVTRIVAPGGAFHVSSDFLIADSGRPDDYAPSASEITIDNLPSEVLPFLLGSRYCETDKLSQLAWNIFGSSWRGWPRV
jgi:hypothetical protein